MDAFEPVHFVNEGHFEGWSGWSGRSKSEMKSLNEETRSFVSGFQIPGYLLGGDGVETQFVITDKLIDDGSLMFWNDKTPALTGL